jgi:hypothetical protein
MDKFHSRKCAKMFYCLGDDGIDEQQKWKSLKLLRGGLEMAYNKLFTLFSIVTVSFFAFETE